MSFADHEDSGGGGRDRGRSSGDPRVRVEKSVQVSQSDWERVVRDHMVIRLCYDPMIGGSVMPASGITGQATSRLVLWVVSAVAGLSIIAMGMVTCRPSRQVVCPCAARDFRINAIA